MKAASRALLLLAGLVLNACSRPEPAKPAEPEAGAYQGREETRTLQNADNIGYDGTGIQKKLDGALDKNDQRSADLDAQIEAQTGSGEPKPTQ
jgi:outer membrane biogenesis lipoprotein LolB